MDGNSPSPPSLQEAEKTRLELEEALSNLRSQYQSAVGETEVCVVLCLSHCIEPINSAGKEPSVDCAPGQTIGVRGSGTG